MSFKHKFPTSVMLIGYLEGAKKMAPSKGSGFKVTAKLYNPSEQYRKYDLRIPLLAMGKPAKMVSDLCKSGDLVSVIGRMAMVSNPNGLHLYILVENVSSLDEEEGNYGMEPNN